MDNFIDFLFKNFGDTARNLSDTGHGNKWINEDMILIKYDDVATYFNEKYDDFEDKFTSADALYISRNNNEFKLFFIEFKNIDYSDEKDKLMNKYRLKECILEMKKCEHNCKIIDSIDELYSKLVDESKVSMRSKPFDSLSLFYYLMNHEIINDLFDCRQELFNMKKFYFVVSKTIAQYNPYSPNKSNRNKTIVEPLRFLKRLSPYHYTEVFVVNEGGFKQYFVDRYKGC